LISLLSTEKLAPKTKHYLGFPPTLTGGSDTRQELSVPSFVIIEGNPDGVFLYRYDAQGACVGDTWHADVEDAKYQASYEYGDSLQAWGEVPPTMDDAVDFGLKQIKLDRYDAD
jgi:hypothetical protein